MKTIERVSIVDQVINNLESYIRDNNLKPGDKMPTEKELCESLGVGRSTVREAYRMMQVTHKVKAVQGKGVFVTEPEEEEEANWFKKYSQSYRDYMEVREAIEPMLVRLAIERANASQIRKLERINEKFRESVESGDPVKMASYDEAFHGYIASITGNQLHATLPHQEILNSFYDKDPEKGSQKMIEHLRISFADFEDSRVAAQQTQ